MKTLKGDLWGYVGRFSLVHVITYVVAGLIFMNLQNYAEIFAVSEGFAHFRSLESPMVKASPLLQFLPNFSRESLVLG